MFEKPQKNYTDQLGKTNRLVEGTTIVGDIICFADCRLDGVLKGNIQTPGKLVIGPAGEVTGDIICGSADVEGYFNGKIQVAELLNIKATATIEGAVITAKLSVEPGAIFMATCQMIQPDIVEK